MIDVLEAISRRLELLDEIDWNRQQNRVLNRQFIQQNGFALLCELKNRDEVGCSVRFDLLFGRSPTTSEKSAHCRRLRTMERFGLIDLFDDRTLSARITREGNHTLDSALEVVS